ncbi:GGDEF domain protein [Shigella flexneri K-272]|nr:GGDEF domain protein [Shigella flexneri K-272]
MVCLWAFLLFFIIMRTRLASELCPLIALLCLASLCCNLLLLTLDEYNYTIWYISRGIEVSSKLFVVSFLIYNIFQELQLSSKLAVHDVLTNIYNRRYFFNSVESLLSRPVVKDFCVMLVDIIQQSIRPDDILARLEGEVFGLLFTELNSAQAKIIAERMRKNVELLTASVTDMMFLNK